MNLCAKNLKFIFNSCFVIPKKLCFVKKIRDFYNILNMIAKKIQNLV